MTAVEFIRQEFLEKLTNENYKNSFDEIINQAKEMEKEQIVKAWENGKKSTQCKAPICQMKTGLGYYHKTFKSE